MLYFEKRDGFISMDDIYEIEFNDDDDSLDDYDDILQHLAPWAKAFVRCGGGYRAFASKRDAKEWEALV